MKKLVHCMVLVVLFFFLVASMFAQQQGEYKKIYRLNVAPLIKGGVKTAEELRALIIKEVDVIELLLGGQRGLVEEFYKQFPRVKIDEFFGRFKAEKMSWRDFNKKPRATGRVDYVGEEKIESFVFEIKFYQIQKTYLFLTPKDCGNISLQRIEELEIERIEEIVREFPPQLLVEPPTQKPNPPKPSEPEPPVITKKESDMDFFAGAGIGGFYSCFMEYGIVELGVRRHISSWVDVLASIGVGVPIGQNKQNWYIVPMVNIDLVGMLFEPVYLGVGIGFSGKMKEGQESQLEFGPDVGFRIKSIDLSFRGRIPFKGDPRGVRGNYKILLGIKIFF